MHLWGLIQQETLLPVSLFSKVPLAIIWGSLIPINSRGKEENKTVELVSAVWVQKNVMSILNE